MTPTTAPSDEGCRDAGPAGADVHVLELVSLAPLLALEVIVARYPAHGRITLVCCLAGPDRPLVSIVEPSLALPRDLELRGPGLWLDLQHLVPFDHVMLGIEAFATGLDDPAEALGRGFGDRVPFGTDLEWDTEPPASAPTGAAPGAHGYELVGQAHGEVLVGAERFELEALGARRHIWGDTVPWAAAWARALTTGGARSLDPGVAEHVVAAGEVLAWAPTVVHARHLPGLPGFRLDRYLVRVQDARLGLDAPEVVWIERSTPC